MEKHTLERAIKDLQQQQQNPLIKFWSLKQVRGTFYYVSVEPEDIGEIEAKNSSFLFLQNNKNQSTERTQRWKGLFIRQKIYWNQETRLAEVSCVFIF